MRLTISITVALLLFAGIAMAADVPTMKGDKAMVFMFDGLANLDLDTYHGGLGMRYYFADYMAIRGGLMFDMGSETEEACSDAPSGYPDEEDSWSDLGIEIVFEKHLEGCAPSVSPYMGIGGGLSMYSMDEECADYYANDDEDMVWGVDVTTTEMTYLEVFGVLGFEWAFTGPFF